ncbi:chloramphenicol efflux pump [Prauserella marina]|uniref:MFS transporter, DHA1 family, chloramphenicol resistance protein n=1 Tax=Prauserella marina TaxID=530584 RepID=A0A222VQJ2_9PSEU|nr:Cmx/CmrA family chloramphenicol efflux MFS transporter [Prauserella marina]ASR36189.1 chloramphenicol efflux pump [Prauserella marina]PWV76940.1 DHA1 family chloramphenicol resistance protein-like MFS transporter [Prauserella marina]SDD00791.1 MFS transporter, DHA1 family, chloramphenicol resistance protein [Prauserella marina]
MPFALYLLGLAVFAQGTSEFMLSGLVPGIARDLAVSIPAAGSLTSAFAVGMIVGAPLMAVVSLRWPRRRALLIFLGTFLAVHVVGALTTDFALLLVTRVVGALANAGFLAVALATATSIVAPTAKGRATAVLLGGVTLACVVGVPAGAVLGQLWGWRSAFWAVVLISLPALVAVLRSVTGEPQPSQGALSELRALREPRLLVVLALGALVNGATFCTFTYLAPIVTDVAGLGSGWIPVLLALFGIGSFAGVTISGRLADGDPVRLLVGGAVALAAGWVVFALLADHLVVLVVLTLVQGTLSFAVGSTLIAKVLYTATEAPQLGGAFATAAFNVGAAIGPWAGGAAIAGGFGYRAPLWVSAGLVGIALVVAATSALPARSSR